MDYSEPYAFEVDSLEGRVSEGEWQTRLNLAAAFRVAHHMGWNDTIGNHIAARVADAPDTMLINPRGLGWHEVTASSLVKADLHGNFIGDPALKPGPAGFNFHSCILRMKPEIACTFHLHPLDGVVVSALEGGLQFFDQSSCALYGEVAYHDFEGLAQEADEGPRIVSDLGDRFAMIMWNHGLLTVGRTIGEAFEFMTRLIAACQVQTKVLGSGVKPRPMPKELGEHTHAQMRRRWANTPFGNLEWKMYLRLADRLDPSYRT